MHCFCERWFICALFMQSFQFEIYCGFTQYFLFLNEQWSHTCLNECHTWTKSYTATVTNGKSLTDLHKSVRVTNINANKIIINIWLYESLHSICEYTSFKILLFWCVSLARCMHTQKKIKIPKIIMNLLFYYFQMQNSNWKSEF